MIKLFCDNNKLKMRGKMEKIHFRLEEAPKVYKALLKLNIKKVYLKSINMNLWTENIDFFCKEVILYETAFYKDEKVNIEHLKYLNYFYSEEEGTYSYYICYFEENLKFNLDLKKYIEEVKEDPTRELVSNILTLSINKMEYLKFNSFPIDEKKEIVESVLKYKIEEASRNPILSGLFIETSGKAYEEIKAELSMIKNEFFKFIEDNEEVEIKKNMKPSEAIFLFYKSIIIAEKKENLCDEDFLEVIKGYFKNKKILKDKMSNKINEFFCISHFRRMVYYYINVLSLLMEMKKNSKIDFDKSSNESAYLRGSKKISYNKINKFLEIAEARKMKVEDIKLIRKLYENYLKEEILITNPKLAEQVKLEYCTSVGNNCYFSDKDVKKVMFAVVEELENGELYIIINKNEENYMGKYNKYLSKDNFLYFENENGFPKSKGILCEDILLKGRVKKLIF